MKHILLYGLLLFFVVPSFEMVAQQHDDLLHIRGSVRKSDTYEPISKVNIEINGGAYTITDSRGKFSIKAKKGDELIVRHKDFETIYYTIVSDDRITIEIEPVAAKNVNSKFKRNIKRFNSLIDSAVVYKKNDVAKSIKFVGEALTHSSSISQNAEAYQVLAEIYMHWEQYDLAVTNYRISLQNIETNDSKLGLAKAYELNKNYQESIDTYKAINKSELGNYQLVTLYEGLGDTYFRIKDYNTSLNTYKKGLSVAKQHLISPKVVDLNSKIAQTYNAKGEVEEAEVYFDNSMNLAEQQTKTRALEEKVAVADFQNVNRNYDKEIELRKEIVEDVLDAERDSIINNKSALTLQKQNYKIGNAYALQKDYDNAISYLEKSIEEAEDHEDLIVKKDATKKLSDVYVDAGDFKKAIEKFKAYTEVVDELYIKREQELSQADRLRRDISKQQNRITSLESDRALNESLVAEQNKTQQIVIYALIGGMLLLTVMAIVMFKYIKQQRLANNLLALKSLRSQMNPHFIFNALNSVNSFIANNDERTANKYLSDFSHLMRSVLENSEEDFIPLQQEIELLELYTKLEHFRFQDKFDYSILVDDAVKVSEYQIPPMLLQPYIENAVWHGLRYKTVKGHLFINVDKKNDTEITISVSDDGIGRERSKALKTEHQKKQNSKGMSNIKKRVAILNEMYKDKVDVLIEDFQDEEDAGTRVIVTLKKD